MAVHAYLLALEGHVRSAGALVLFLPAILLLLTSFGLDGWRDGPIEPSLKLQAAIRKYWHHLLVISLFPTEFFVGCGYFKVAFEFVVLRQRDLWAVAHLDQTRAVHVPVCTGCRLARRRQYVNSTILCALCFSRSVCCAR